MVYEHRVAIDYTFGVLSSPAAISDLTMSSANFAGLPSDLTTPPAYYIPIVLRDDSIPAIEVVWITAHTAASQTVTVLRAQQGRPARAWPAQTQWMIAPTARDLLISAADSSGLPGNPHVGARVTRRDLGRQVQRSYDQNWITFAASAPEDVLAEGGSAIPSQRHPLIKAAVLSGTTDSNGRITFTIPNSGYANACVNVQATVANSNFTCRIESYSTTQVVLSFYTAVGALAGAGNVLKVHLTTIGH